MEPLILQRMKQVTEYADTTFDAILQVGATRLQSINFSLIIAAGQTQGQIPVDNFDINSDTLILDMNTRSADTDAVTTQVPGQRAVITIPVFPEDTKITGMILKNVVVAKNEMSVSGTLIGVGTMPSDRLLAIPESVNGSIMERDSIELLAVKSESLSEYYSAFDVNNIPTVTVYKNSNGQKVKEVILSNPDGNMNYQTITVKYYKNGDINPYGTRVGNITYTGTRKTSLEWQSYIEPT